MALIGEMQYLTIGGNTYSLPSGGGGSVTSVAVSNATNGGLSVSGSPISSSGTITIGHSNVLSSAQTTQAVYPIKIDKNGHISAYGTAVTIPDISGKVNITETNSGTTTNVIRSDSGIELQASNSNWTAIGVYPGTISLATEIDSGGYPGIHLTKTDREIIFQNGTIKYTPTGSSYTYTITGAPTAARTLTLPNATGTIALTSNIPTVNNATLTIQKNGTTVNSFTANASSNVTANITVPTKVSELTNDSGYAQLAGASFTGPVTFGDSISVDEATIGDLVVNGGASFTNGVKATNYNGGQPTYTVIGTQTAATGSWTGNIDLPALYDGLRIAYYLPYAGNGNATLNLTLSDGTTTGAIDCYYNTSRLTTHYSAGYCFHMTYWSAGSIKISGTATSTARWIAEAQYNSDYTIGYSWTAAATAAKSFTANYFYLDSTNQWFPLCLIYGNSYAGAITFNINNAGAKPVYINGAASSSTNYSLPKGYYLVYWDGTNFYVRTDGKITGSITGNAATVGGHTVGVNVPSNAVFTDSTVSTLTLASGNTAGTSLTSGGKFTLTAGDKTVSFTMPTIPTVPSNIVNTITTTAGTHTTISSQTGTVSFNVPTKTSHLTNDSGFITASHTSTYSLPLAASGTRGGVQIGYSESGTNYAVKLSSEKMYVTVPWTDTKVTTAALTSGTTYYPILATGTGTATRQIDSTLGGLKYVSTAGTTSAVGTATLNLGNTTASGTANNEKGVLRLYGTGATYYTDLVSGTPTANRTITFPDKAGTVALTSDIPSVSYPVTSVNNKTGAVSLTASDVGALASSTTYVSTITTTAGAHTAISSKSGAVSFNVPTTAAHVGAAASSHTHGNITNGGDITATAPTIASGDQIIINDNSASKITNGPTFDGSTTTKALSQKGTWETFSNSLLYGECTIAAATAAKTVTVDSSFKLETGATVAVKFSNSNTASSPTLNVNSTGAKTIYRYGTTSAGTTAQTSWSAESVVCFVFDGTGWRMMDWQNDNTMVTQNHSTSTAVYNMALANYSSSSGGTSTLNHSNKIQANPSTGDTLQSGRATTADLSSSDVTTFVNSLNYSQINAVDYVVEQGASGNWYYRKWNSGIGECWLPSYNPGTYTIGTTRSSLYSGANLTLTFPIVFTSAPSATGNVSLGTDAYVVWLQFNGLGTTTAQCRMVSSGSVAANSNYLISVYVIGRWK